MRKSTAIASALIIFMLIPISSSYSGGSAESGRRSALELASSGKYIAQSYIDVEAFLDDYSFDYVVEPTKALSLFIEADKPVLLDRGGIVDVQIAIASNQKEFFEQKDLDYVIFIQNKLFLEDDRDFSSLSDTIESLRRGNPNSRFFCYLPKEGALEELQNQSEIERLLSKARNAGTDRDHIKTLENILVQGERLAGTDGSGVRPLKILWVTEEQIISSEADLNKFDFIFRIHALPYTEISFCGYGDKFRSGTMNRLVTQYGGNTYYLSATHELSATLKKDFDYYSYPAVKDLEIVVYPSEFSQNPNLQIRYKHVSMGFREHHRHMVQLNVSHKYYALRLLNNNVKAAFNEAVIIPIAFVFYEYFDCATGSVIFGSKMINIEYTDDYQRYDKNRNRRVEKDRAILNTAIILQQVSDQIQSRRLESAALLLQGQIRALREVSQYSQDALISEDIETLTSYKELLLEQIKNPVKDFKIFFDLKRKHY